MLAGKKKTTPRLGKAKLNNIPIIINIIRNGKHQRINKLATGEITEIMEKLYIIIGKVVI